MDRLHVLPVQMQVFNWLRHFSWSSFHASSSLDMPSNSDSIILICRGGTAQNLAYSNEKFTANSQVSVVSNPFYANHCRFLSYGMLEILCSSISIMGFIFLSHATWGPLNMMCFYVINCSMHYVQQIKLYHVLS